MRQRPENALAKTITMNKNCIPVAVLVAGALFALSTPLRAQIATQVDEHGKLVFVNGDSPNARRGSTISPTSGASHSRSGISTGLRRKRSAPMTDGWIALFATQLRVIRWIPRW